MTVGELLIRDAEEPYALTSPTRVTGTNTDGALSGVELDTPTVRIVQEVPQYGTTATIDAQFSMAAPGTGSINEQGDVVLDLSLAVELHIAVPILPGDHVCTSSPVDLTLTSTAPHDGERVTLTDANFAVPSVPAAATCPGVLAAEVNETLAGAGHGLTLTFEGPLRRPTLGEPTLTTLSASPASGARLGDDLTLTATVAPAPEVQGAPPISGTVSFFDGDTLLGTAAVGEDGTAPFTTELRAAGARQLTARYAGASPHWDPSEAAITYTVVADAVLTTDAAGEVQPGGPGREIGVSVVNTGLGAALDDAHLDVDIRRADGYGPVGPNLVTLSRVVEGVPTPVPLDHVTFPEHLEGSIGDLDVPVGSAHDEELILSVAAGIDPGPLALTFTLVDDEEDVVTTSGAVTVVRAARQATSLGAGDPGFFPFFPEVLPVTPVVRQGNVVQVNLLRVEPRIGPSPQGTFSFTVGDVPVLAELDGKGGFEESVPTGAPVGAAYILRLPPNIPTGTQVVKAIYSGDTHYAPSEGSWPITVAPSIGKVYECVSQGIFSATFTANVEVVTSTLPPAWGTGRDIELRRVDVRIRMSRTAWHEPVLGTPMQSSPADRTLQLSTAPTGTVTWDAITRTNPEPPVTGDLNGPDHLVELTGGTGAISVTHAPGTDATYAVDRITITGKTGGFIGGMICTPVNPEAHVLGTVTAAGTTLAVEPGEVVGEGRDVTLTAAALPAAPGAIEFRDGTTTIGVVTVDANGVAAMTTDDLPLGTRSLTARFFGGVVATLPSAAVELRVAACGDASESGNGAVVRLVYLELLGRCPDAAGYDFWVDRLDGGTSPEVFARSIARTPEAVGRVVDDAYETMLGRPADAAGRVFWRRRLQASGRYDQLLADLAASGEFWSKAGSANSGAVTRIYERLLERSPDQGGLDFWVGRLDGGVSRRALVLSLANLAEPLGVLVDDAFDEILDRKPTTTERSEGVAFLRSTGDRSGLYARLIGTGEFHDRAQGLPDPD